MNAAYDFLGVVDDYFSEAHQRNSIDDNGMRLTGVVHYGEDFNNAFWNGQRMVFGDGDGVQFTDFTQSFAARLFSPAISIAPSSANLTCQMTR